MNLTIRNSTFVYPEIKTPKNIFEYIAKFNKFEFYETDINGVVLNSIFQNYFFVNKTELATPIQNENEFRYDGFLFVGIPNDHGTDVDGNDGLYQNVMQILLSKDYLVGLKNLISCDFKVIFNNIRPLYNTTKYTKSTNTTGIEISYSIWI